MLRQRNFANDLILVTDDLVKPQEFTRETFDVLVQNAVSHLRYYTGFSAFRTGAAQVTVSAGHYWAGGPVFGRADVTVFNLLQDGNYIPPVTRRYVAIVTYGETVPDAQTERLYETDDQGTKEPRPLHQETVRVARLSLVSGAQAPDPQKPTLDASVIPVAWILLNNEGVVSVEQAEEFRLPSIESLNQHILRISTWRDQIGQILDTILSEQLRTQASIPPDLTPFVLELFARVEALENMAKQPSTAVKTFIDRFTSLRDSDTAYAGYKALVEDGLRFPQGASTFAKIVLNNPTDDKITVANNILTPKQTGVAPRITIDNPNGALSISQYTSQTTERVQKTISREVIVYEQAAHFLLTPNRSGLDHTVGTVFTALKQAGLTNDQINAWLGTLYNQIALMDVKMTKAQKFKFRGPTGDTYDIEVVGTSTGYKATIKGLARTSKTDETYWEEVTKDATVTGSQFAQTFPCPTNGWLREVGTPWDQVALTGDVRVFIVETRGGKPVKDSVISQGTIPVANLRAGAEVKCQIEPVYLQGGRSYAVIWVSTGNHFVKVRTGNKYVGGSAYYLSDTGEWIAVQNSGDICMSLYFAAFEQTRVEVQMQPLQRAGGIAGIRINAAQHVPEGTKLLHEVQRTGKWYQISEGEAAALDGNPALLNYRIVFIGTRDLMPAIDMSQTEIELTGPVEDLVHVSKVHTLDAATNNVQAHYEVRGYNPAKHDLDCALIVPGSPDTLLAPESIHPEPDPQDDSTVRFVATFKPVGITSYRVKTMGELGSADAGFVVTERRDFPF